jgi:signal peptidase I
MWESLLALAAAVALLMLMQAFVIQVFTVSSGSMLPTLLPRDSVLVNRLAYRLHPPHRGDIIVFRFPQADGREFVKRVIGLPGDVVEEQSGRVHVNGKPLALENTAGSGQGTEPAMTIAPHRMPPGQLFVLGDNQAASLDSRYWGTVDIDKVVGKAFLVYWSHGKEWWDVRWDRIGYWLP